MIVGFRACGPAPDLELGSAMQPAAFQSDPHANKTGKTGALQGSTHSNRHAQRLPQTNNETQTSRLEYKGPGLMNRANNTPPEQTTPPLLTPGTYNTYTGLATVVLRHRSSHDAFARRTNERPDALTVL